MADETPQQTSPQEESKKDTVRINLPPGVGGRTGAPPPGSPTNSATTRLKPAGATGSTDDEAKKETSVMGMPVTAPKPKKDTSRVQVATAKPGPPEPSRPIMRLKQEERPLPPTPVSAPAAPGSPASAHAAAAVTSAADAGLAIGAIVLSVAVLVYLTMVARVAVG
jgi:hypothetical protein